MKKKRTVLLFVPGDRPDYIPKALASGADSVIFDLEDAVAPERKETSRETVERSLKENDFSGCELVVRINPLSTPWGREDLEMLLRSTVADALLVPKADPEEVQKIISLVGGTSMVLICLIETARGLQLAYETALASPKVNGLMLGAEDLALDMHLKRSAAGGEISYARQVVALAAYAARIQPIDTPFLQVSDFEGLRLDTEEACARGFTAKAAISPKQVPIIRECLKPDRDEVEKAKQIVKRAEEAKNEGCGIATLDRLMIDEPVVARARRVLELALQEESNHDH